MLTRKHTRPFSSLRPLVPIGLAFALAAACSDDSSNGDDDESGDSVGTPVTVITAATPTITVATATSSTGSTGTTSGFGGNGGTGGAGDTGGAAGAAGAACEPDPTSGLPTGAAGAAGGGGAPGAGYDDGFHFTDPESVEAWRIKPVADCPECIPDATLGAGCGTLLMTANWPEEANEGSLKSTAELNASGDERWDLSGKTVTVRVRWASGADLDNNGFDVYLELLDEDWSFFGPTLGETFDTSDTFFEWTATLPSEPEGDFDPATVRQINVRFDTKFWTDDDAPPTFSYDTTVFEIDAVVW